MVVPGLPGTITCGDSTPHEPPLAIASAYLLRLLLFLPVAFHFGFDGVLGSGARGAILEPLARLLCSGVGERNVLGLLHELVEVALLEVEVDELLDRWVFLERLRAHVDEQGSRERVFARLNRLPAGRDAINGECLELLLVLLEVAEAEVSQGVRVARDTLHENVIVLAGLVVRPARALLAVDPLGEEVEGAGLRTGTVEVEPLLGPLGAHLVPLGNLALRLRSPHGRQLVERYVVSEVVPGVDHDREAVQGHRNLDELDAVLLAGLDLVVLYGPGSVRDLGISVAERLEAVTGTRAPDGYLHVRVLPIEPLGRRLGDGQHGAGALDGYLARATITGCLGVAAFLFFILSATATAAA